MQKEPISLQQYDLLAPRLKEVNVCFSEYNFSNLFLFRREHEYQVIKDKNEIWIQGKLYDGMTFLMPTYPLLSISQKDILEKLDRVDCIYPIPESWLIHLDPALFLHSTNPADSDYIYLREKIATYSGSELKQKREVSRQFFRNFSPTVVSYHRGLYQDALSILDKWHQSIGKNQVDYLPCKDGLDYFDDLHLTGYLIYVQEKPVALIFGEISIKNYFLMHFAKALMEYKGIYPYLFQALAEKLATEEVTYLNWERDLGNVGLRQSKQSYRPERLEHKYRVFKK